MARLFVGIYGDSNLQKNQQMIARAKALSNKRDVVLASGRTGRKIKKEKLTIAFFKSKTARIWESHDSN